ncbi:S-adenosylmethionine--tRNA ribosyltransferase-isomerase [Salmonella enterica subsp. enterica serovar Heidelberg str. RI-11-014316]|nr:S-adenosylmethionine--tRNA ribosyltransferase-isomerase [Salmonella enterica subsp. enterica serovar Heidelberg str. RI-11-014316]
MPKNLLAHKFDPFPAVTLSEFCLFCTRYPAHDYAAQA